MKYRRTYQKGGTYFFTVNLADRSKTLLIDQIDDLYNSIKYVQSKHYNDSGYSTRWMLIKFKLSKYIHSYILASTLAAYCGFK